MISIVNRNERLNNKCLGEDGKCENPTLVGRRTKHPL